MELVSLSAESRGAAACRANDMHWPKNSSSCGRTAFCLQRADRFFIDGKQIIHFTTCSVCLFYHKPSLKERGRGGKRIFSPAKTKRPDANRRI
jgi:hypothetical protein